jgi:hypothetical protein
MAEAAPCTAAKMAVQKNFSTCHIAALGRSETAHEAVQALYSWGFIAALCNSFFAARAVVAPGRKIADNRLAIEKLVDRISCVRALMANIGLAQ